MEHGVLCVAALGWEAAAIVPAIDGAVVSRRGPFTLWKGRGWSAPHWVLRAGVGPDRAERGVRWALDVVRPTVIASTGCAGALASGIGIGDVVVADAVVDGTGKNRATSVEWRERYRRASLTARLAPHEGRILTSDAVLLSQERKKRAGEVSGALAVEMEAAAIADWCCSKGIEFSAARVILDSADMTLAPELPAILGAEGYASAPRLLRALVHRPALLRELLAVGSAMRTCRRALRCLHRDLIAGLR